MAEGFRGFKMVPPGPHYLSYNAASRAGEFAPTVAVLAHLAGRQVQNEVANQRKTQAGSSRGGSYPANPGEFSLQVLVRRWSPQEELLLPLQDEDEVRRCQIMSLVSVRGSAPCVHCRGAQPLHQRAQRLCVRWHPWATNIINVKIIAFKGSHPVVLPRRSIMRRACGVLTLTQGWRLTPWTPMHSGGRSHRTSQLPRCVPTWTKTTKP